MVQRQAHIYWASIIRNVKNNGPYASSMQACLSSQDLSINIFQATPNLFASDSPLSWPVLTSSFLYFFDRSQQHHIPYFSLAQVLFALYGWMCPKLFRDQKSCRIREVNSFLASIALEFLLFFRVLKSHSDTAILLPGNLIYAAPTGLSSWGGGGEMAELEQNHLLATLLMAWNSNWYCLNTAFKDCPRLAYFHC